MTVWQFENRNETALLEIGEGFFKEKIYDKKGIEGAGFRACF